MSSRTLPPDVFAHDFLPPGLRRQILALWKQSLASLDGGAGRLSAIRTLACGQPGAASLPASAADDAQHLADCLMHSPATETVLDAIGFSLVMLSASGQEVIAKDAAAAVNALFHKHGVGCAFAFEESGMLLRDEDRTRHNQLVAPALAVMAKPKFAAAGSRYQAAFAAYDQGRWSDSMTECCEALQAVLQAGLAARLVEAFPGSLSAAAIRKFLAEFDLPTGFEPPCVLLGSLRVLLAAAGGAAIAGARISPRQAQGALHATAAAVLVLAAASQ